MKIKTAYPSTTKTLLEKLDTKKLTLEDFMQEIAYWIVKELDDITPRQYPHKPEEVWQYEELSQQKFFDKGKHYRESSVIQEYYNTCSWVKHQNQSNLWWLREAKKRIPEEDILTHKRLEEKILEFEALEDGGEKRVLKIKKTFKVKDVGDKDQTPS